jgi:hypothetical protein
VNDLEVLAPPGFKLCHAKRFRQLLRTEYIEILT